VDTIETIKTIREPSILTNVFKEAKKTINEWYFKYM
jgi:hypothetical protein